MSGNGSAQQARRLRRRKEEIAVLQAENERLRAAQQAAIGCIDRFLDKTLNARDDHDLMEAAVHLASGSEGDTA